MRIQWRIFLTTTLVTLLGLSALIILSVQQLNNATLEFYQHDLQSEALTLAGQATEVMEEDEIPSSASLQTWLLRHRTQTDYHLTLLDQEGRVLADTNPSSLVHQLIQTDEIEAALRGKTEHYIRHDTAYTASPILYEGEIIGVLRVSAPMQPAYAEVRRHWLEFGLEAIPIFLITLLGTLWVGRTIVNPIKKLTSAALQMAGGAWDERIEVQSKDEIGQLSESFNYMAEQIEQYVANQRSFVSNAAHELRNPLMSLKLRVQSLLHETLPPEEQQQYLQEMDTEIHRLSHLVTELLALARLDEGRQPAQLAPFDVSAFLQDILHHTQIQAHQAHIDLITEFLPTLPDVAITQPDFRVILDNLLSNALKYTPSGGIIYLKSGVIGGQFECQVKDTGEGFTPEDQAKLFERFFRVDRARNRQVMGTGLGLAIVRSLVEKYHGTITAESEGIGQGATFTLRLPLL